ncbi:hypothetical protein [Zhihengliuella halotolerans]|uniref:hypothetical protein n=1 Tax=Zhihengliuella halotolerans TaxID=370736 RepID=UPI000C7F79E0|nr:hypothetical protein [Zhihengliuella halotolerans]
MAFPHYSTDPERDRIQRLIDDINSETLWERRLVDGRDLNEWLHPLAALEAAGDYAAALALLERIIETTHALVQYDVREPQAYWAEKAAALHIKSGRPDRAISTLQHWLDAWPEERAVKNRDRARIRARLTKLMEQHHSS